MALEVPKAGNKAVAEEVKAPVQAEAAVEANEVYGEARKDLAFVCPLGDPSNPDTTKVKAADGTVDTKVTSTIVGYKFKVLKDMMVPDCGTNDGFKNDPMNYADVDKWIQAKAGDVIMLTPFETALLLSQPQFNGGCEGGEKPVSCVYQTKVLKAQKGGVATASAASATPRVSLRAQVGSIKDFDIEDVLTYTVKKLENGTTRKERTMKPGYDKWAPLAKAATKRATGTKAKAEVDPRKVANKNAQSFLAFVNNKSKKAQ